MKASIFILGMGRGVILVQFLCLMFVIKGYYLPPSLGSILMYTAIACFVISLILHFSN